MRYWILLVVALAAGCLIVPPARRLGRRALAVLGMLPLLVRAARGFFGGRVGPAERLLEPPDGPVGRRASKTVYCQNPKCGRANRPEARYCGRCGTKLTD